MDHINFEDKVNLLLTDFPVEVDEKIIFPTLFKTAYNFNLASYYSVLFLSKDFNDNHNSSLLEDILYRVQDKNPLFRQIILNLSETYNLGIDSTFFSLPFVAAQVFFLELTLMAKSKELHSWISSQNNTEFLTNTLENFIEEIKSVYSEDEVFFSKFLLFFLSKNTNRFSQSLPFVEREPVVLRFNSYVNTRVLTEEFYSVISKIPSLSGSFINQILQEIKDSRVEPEPMVESFSLDTKTLPALLLGRIPLGMKGSLSLYLEKDGKNIFPTGFKTAYDFNLASYFYVLSLSETFEEYYDNALILEFLRTVQTNNLDFKQGLIEMFPEHNFTIPIEIFESISLEEQALIFKSKMIERSQKLHSWIRTHDDPNKLLVTTIEKLIKEVKYVYSKDNFFFSNFLLFLLSKRDDVSSESLPNIDKLAETTVNYFVDFVRRRALTENFYLKVEKTPNLYSFFSLPQPDSIPDITNIIRFLGSELTPSLIKHLPTLPEATSSSSINKIPPTLSPITPLPELSINSTLKKPPFLGKRPSENLPKSPLLVEREVPREILKETSPHISHDILSNLLSKTQNLGEPYRLNIVVFFTIGIFLILFVLFLINKVKLRYSN